MGYADWNKIYWRIDGMVVHDDTIRQGLTV